MNSIIESAVNHSQHDTITEEQNKIAISKANIVKQDINYLLMVLGANNDVDVITQKMDQLGRSIADLDKCICDLYGKAGQTGGQPNRAA